MANKKHKWVPAALLSKYVCQKALLSYKPWITIAHSASSGIFAFLVARSAHANLHTSILLGIGSLITGGLNEVTTYIRNANQYQKEEKNSK